MSQPGVAVFAGEQRTGGYSILVKSIEDPESERRIAVEFTVPPPDTMVTDALTQPHHIVRMSKTSLPIKFVDAENGISFCWVVVLPCGFSGLCLTFLENHFSYRNIVVPQNSSVWGLKMISLLRMSGR